MTELTKLYLSMAANLIVFAVTIFIYSRAFFQLRQDSKDGVPAGSKIFRFYTTDSNIFSAISCGITLFWELFNCIGCGVTFPHWLVLLKFFSTSTVTLTLIIVVLFLGPTQGYGIMFSGRNIHAHFVGPLLAIISFCFLESFGGGAMSTASYISLEEAFVGVVPTLIYALFYLRQVVFVRGDYLIAHPEKANDENLPGWPDFYGFNRGGKWPISVVAISAVTLIIGLLIRGLHNM